ncbi:MAG TPA: alpha/beta fold hydrolase [Thermoanaerobaculia bacterium]
MRIEEKSPAAESSILNPQSSILDFPPYKLHETRAGAGTPVALVHGLSGSSRWWSRNLEALAAQHLVAAVDLVGFGQNQRFRGLPRILPSFEEAASLVARWLETFGEPVHLVGHSMGGQISIRVAAERPDLVRSLTLVNAVGIPFTIDPGAHIRVLPKPPYGGASIARVLVPDFLRAGPTSVATATLRVLRGDARDWMHAIRAPVLLVWGANDPIVPLRYGEAMQREIEGSRLEVIPAAHVAMWDNPAEFNRLALEFFAEVEGAMAAEAHERFFSWGISGWTDGMAHRQAGHRRDVVLIHGLGMSSHYFIRFAQALYSRGHHPIAPDLPGFGESVNARAAGPAEHAQLLAEWGDKLGIRDAVWIGHSIGCNAVAHLARLRPDLVLRSVMIGPLWTASRHQQIRMFTMLALDALRESLALYRYIIPAYWRTGVARWWLTWRRYVEDLHTEPPPDALMLSGERDPIPDRRRVTITHMPGAHACHFSYPDETAEKVGER